MAMSADVGGEPITIGSVDLDRDLEGGGARVPGSTPTAEVGSDSAVERGDSDVERGDSDVDRGDPAVERGEVTAGQPRVLWDRAATEFTAWREGDRSALDRLVRLVTPMLWHLARAYRLDQQTAEDVVQGTLVSMVRYAERIDDPQALIRWLAVTARRDAWRCARAAQRVEVVEDTLLDLRVGPAEGPETEVLKTHRDRALWQAVAALDERCQRLLRTVAFCDRPNYVRLSEELQMPVGSIGPTRGRCLEKMKNLLGDTDWRTT